MSKSRLLITALLTLALAAVPARAQVSGQNVNMVSGTNWTNGDPFLQRQNEPSIAASSRNPSHLLAGANDYRIEVPEKTAKVIDGFPPSVRREFQERLDELAQNPRPGWARVTGIAPPLWALRAGHCWLLYEVNDAEKKITVKAG